MREIRPDQRLPFGRRPAGAPAEPLDHRAEALLKELLHLLMPVAKLPQYFAEHPADFRFRQAHHLPHDPARDFFTGWSKRPHQYARMVGSKRWADAFGVHGGYG